MTKRKAPCLNILFSEVAVKQRTLHHIYFLTAVSVRPKYQNLIPSSHYCLTRQPPCIACALQPPTFYVFIVVWCIARQATRNGETVKHFYNWITLLLQICTPYCKTLWQYSDGPKRGGAHENAQIPYLQVTIFASKFWARKLWQLITL